MGSGDYVEYLTGHTWESQPGVFCLQESQIRTCVKDLREDPKEYI